MSTRSLISLSLVLLLIFLLGFGLLSPRKIPIIIPLTCLLSLFGLFLQIQVKKNGYVDILDWGFFIILSLFMYATVPLVQFLLLDPDNPLYMNDRIMRLSPDIEELVAPSWYYVVFMGFFGVFYYVLVGRNKQYSIKTGHTGQSTLCLPGVTLTPSITVIGGLIVFLIVLFGLVEMETGYTRHLSNIQVVEDTLKGVQVRLPHFINQILNKLFLLKGFLAVLLAVCLFLKFRRSGKIRWLVLLGGWLFYELIFTIALKGGRAELVRLLVACAILWDQYVLKIKSKYFVAGTLILIILFLALGTWRKGGIGRELDMHRFLLINNEFMSLYATALEVYMLNKGGMNVPWQVYFQDILAPVPSQYLPFEKITGSQWYVNLINMQDRGVGFAFGVTSEAIVGGGFLGCAARALVLALIAYYFKRMFISRKNNFYVFSIYLYFCINAYRIVRYSAFAWLNPLVWTCIPGSLVVVLFNSLSRVKPIHYKG